MYFLTHSQTGLRMCSSIWNGVLSKGMEQTKNKMGFILGTIIDELGALNIKSKTFKEVIQSSTLNTYEAYFVFYYQRTYLILDEMFNELRSEKLNFIITLLQLILFSYIAISIFLSLIFIFIIYGYKNMFNSFLNFIRILPTKYSLEDEKFYKEVIKLGSNYF